MPHPLKLGRLAQRARIDRSAMAPVVACQEVHARPPFSHVGQVNAFEADGDISTPLRDRPLPQHQLGLRRQRDFISREEAVERVLTTLQFFWNSKLFTVLTRGLS